jgi:hypothetical protein
MTDTQPQPLAIEASQGRTSLTGSIILDVTVEANAPAYTRPQITVTANASQGTCVTAAGPATATFNIQPGFYELWQARFGQSIHKYGQNTNFQIPLVVENSGNGRIEVQVAHLRDENGNGRGMDVVVPGGRHPVGSEAQGHSDRSMTLPIDVQTPFKNGYMNERIPLTIRSFTMIYPFKESDKIKCIGQTRPNEENPYSPGRNCSGSLPTTCGTYKSIMWSKIRVESGAPYPCSCVG